MNKKNISRYAIFIALMTLVSCTSNKSTSKKSSHNTSATNSSAPQQLRNLESKCLYTTQQPYASTWERNVSQENLIESLKKRITMLEERSKQKDGNLLPIPTMVVEPLAKKATYKPHDNCMNQLTVKTLTQLKADNAKQEAQIRELQKKSTELMLDLRSRR